MKGTVIRHRLNADNGEVIEVYFLDYGSDGAWEWRVLSGNGNIIRDSRDSQYGHDLAALRGALNFVLGESQ